MTKVNLMDFQPLTFEEWIAALEGLLDKHKAEHGERPYGEGSLSETTGLDSWRNYYDDAYTPGEAFLEDMSYWED